MWKLFWGEDFEKILASNRKNVVPGAWRIEVSPAAPAEEDFFLHVCEIGDTDTTGRKRVELLEGVNLKGAAVEGGSVVLFSSTGAMNNTGEISLPDLASRTLLITCLVPESVYELNFGGLNVSSSSSAVLPGVSAGTERVRTNGKGILRSQRQPLSNLRLRIAKV